MQNLKTERLIFKKATEDDAAFYLELLNEPGYLANIGDRGVRTLDDAREYIRTRHTYEDGDYGFFVLRLREGGEKVGIAGILNRDFLEEADLGYGLLSRFEGKGYATEAGVAVRDYAKDILGLAKIGAIVAPHNHASIRIIEKLGLSYQKEVIYPGEEEPIQYYEVSWS